MVINADDLKIGDFIFMDAPSANPNSYNKGEYIFVRKTPFTVFGISANGSAYDAHALLSFNMEGKDAYVISNRKHDSDAVAQLAVRIQNEIDEVVSGKKKAGWGDYVYVGAQATINLLKEGLIKTCDGPHSQPIIKYVEKIVYKDKLPDEYRKGRWIVVNGMVSQVPTNSQFTISIP